MCDTWTGSFFIHRKHRVVLKYESFDSYELKMLRKDARCINAPQKQGKGVANATLLQRVNVQSTFFIRVKKWIEKVVDKQLWLV